MELPATTTFEGGSELLHRRIHEAMATAGKSRAEAAGALDRDGRSTEQWQAALRDVAAGKRRYRIAPLEPEELLEIVEDGAADPTRRIAAAYATSTTGDPAALERVRIAAAASANAETQALLEAAAEGELAESSAQR